MLDEIEKYAITCLIGHKYLRALPIFMAGGNIALEEIVPRVCSLELICTIEFNFLPFDCEQEELSRLDQEQVDVIFVLKAEDRATLDLFKTVYAEDVDGALN